MPLASDETSNGTFWAVVAVLGLAALLVGIRFARQRAQKHSDTPDSEPAPPQPRRARPPTTGRSSGQADDEARRIVLRIVRRCPAIGVRDLLARSGIRKARALAALDDLLARGAVERRGTEARWHFFEASSDLDETWEAQATLADDECRLLRGVLEEFQDIEQRQVVAVCRDRWSWSPTTTKRRLQRLARVGLAKATKTVPRGTQSVTWSPSAP